MCFFFVPIPYFINHHHHHHHHHHIVKNKFVASLMCDLNVLKKLILYKQRELYIENHYTNDGIIFHTREGL